MKVAPRLFEQLCTKLGELCPPSTLRLTGLELFLGPSPDAPEPALVGHLIVGDMLPDAAELAERLRATIPEDVPIPLVDGEDVTPAAVAGLVARVTASLLARAIGLEPGSGSSSAGEDGALFWVEVVDETAALRAASIALLAIGSSLGRKSRPATTLRGEAASLCQRHAPTAYPPCRSAAAPPYGSSAGAPAPSSSGSPRRTGTGSPAA